MIRIKDIQESLLHMVGWRQDEQGNRISDYITQSESGMFFQQAHQLLTLQNIRSIAPDYDSIANTDISTVSYTKGRSYKKGDIIPANGRFYLALADIASFNPDTKISDIVEVDPFSIWLANKTKDSISKMVNRFCNEKLSDRTMKSLCENKSLFNNTGRITDVVSNKSRLVGFEIVPIRANGVTTKINKIGLQFTEPGRYVLYLMHSSSFKPVRTIEIDKRIKGFEWFTFTDLFLPYIGDNTDAGGSWYLCYRQSELPENSQAIKKDRDWSKGPCKSCTRQDYISWEAWSKYIEIHPFYIDEALAEDIDGSVVQWDVDNNVYTYDNNYGINLEVSVCCDFTDFIISNREAFQDILMKQVAVDMLREFIYNPNIRTNRHVLNASRQDIIYELEGDAASLKKSGLSYMLDEAYKALSIAVTGLDRVCIPCKNNGIKYRTI